MKKVDLTPATPVAPPKASTAPAVPAAKSFAKLLDPNQPEAKPADGTLEKAVETAANGDASVEDLKTLILMQQISLMNGAKTGIASGPKVEQGD